MDIAELLAFSAKQGLGPAPFGRFAADDPGRWRRASHQSAAAGAQDRCMSSIYEIMNDKQRKDYEEFLETDFSFEIPGVARFRVNAFNQNRGAGGVPDHPSKVMSHGGPGHGPGVQGHLRGPRGLVLVTGPTGSGKSTTLAAMIDYINDTEYGTSSRSRTRSNSSTRARSA
jgi:twitching motility protein PilT